MFNEWAQRWNIPREALAELQAIANTTPAIKPKSSEAVAQQQVRLEAPKRGVRLWRNNNGACYDKDDRLVRYGLANDSKTMSDKIKSSDLIGMTPYTIIPADVGRTVGIFTSIEMKKPGWKYTGTKREQAQLAWIMLVLSLGGFAQFATGASDIWHD